MEIEPSSVDSLTSVVGGSEIRPEELIRGREIGRGNFGIVYEGTCQRKQVAIKVIKCDLTSTKLAELRKEIQINLSLRHPNVVLTMGACTTVPGEITIVSEIMKTDLKKLIIDNDGEAVPFLKRMRMCRDAAAGVLWLHTRNPPIIHRDIKLENFLVNENGEVKVCDFGLSQIKDKPFLRDEKDHARGTPLWMPPEVLSGKPLTEKADVYSFGLMLWSMVTCMEHFQYINTYQQLCQTVKSGVRPPMPADISPQLSCLIQACWAGDQEQRPSFQRIVDELDDIIESLELPTPGARVWWHSSFGRAARVPWPTFINAFCHHFAVVAADITVESVLSARTEQCVRAARCIRCLEALVADKESGAVPAEKFGEAVAWLGDIAAHGRRILVVAERVLRQPYFFGDITKEDSERLLGGKPPGTFLVRFSTTTLGGYTVSRVTMKGTVSHVRLKHPPGSCVYSYASHAGGEVVRASVVELIEAVSGMLRLESPCPGWPFEYLFVAGREGCGRYDDGGNGYEDEEDDDDEEENGKICRDDDDDDDDDSML